jgi:hypothetical protein
LAERSYERGGEFRDQDSYWFLRKTGIVTDGIKGEQEILIEISGSQNGVY